LCWETEFTAVSTQGVADKFKSTDAIVTRWITEEEGEEEETMPAEG
jgi:hypothetical protein